MLPLNGIGYQMIKLWMPHCYSSIFEAASIHFEADSSALHDIFLNTPQYISIDYC